MADPVKGRTAAGRRREERARATRDRIVAAATALFLDRGYTSTTVEAIASEAGVAAATVYQAFGTKSAVLARALDVAVAGDAEPVPLLEREWVAAARRHGSPRRRLAAVVEHTARIAARTAPLKAVMRDAAATESAIRELLARDDARRLTTQRGLLEVALGRPPTDEEAAVCFLLVHSGAFLLASEHLGWSEDGWRRWLLETLERRLLPAAGLV
ncbi:MAG TPA: helix-turn-helix domain-containing protein [Acidimicrobiales bacterium]|jgi:AcrR family transcriptional regulator|nr:helix-turn-helix domain-containing protein [Acidimicrobiales bacterium]